MPFPSQSPSVTGAPAGPNAPKNAAKEANVTDAWFSAGASPPTLFRKSAILAAAVGGPVAPSNVRVNVTLPVGEAPGIKLRAERVVIPTGPRVANFGADKSSQRAIRSVTRVNSLNMLLMPIGIRASRLSESSVPWYGNSYRTR